MISVNSKNWQRSVAIASVCVVAGLGGIPHFAAAAGKTTTVYTPGVSLVPEVLLPDGVTPRTYNTTSGLSIWTNTLPIVQGDKVKLNVFAATGGAELKEIIVRLDNTKIADVSNAPWQTMLDTTKLAAGHHMVEVWAQSNGSRPQSATQTLMFYVANQLAAQYVPQQPTLKVAGSSQQLSNGQISTLPLPGENAAANADTAPTLDFLKTQTLDTNAQVAVYARSAASGTATETGTGTLVTGANITLSEPTLLSVQPAQGSDATQFAYALVRSGTVVFASTSAYDLNRYRVRLEKLNSAGTGLGSGVVTMWVWGINKSGQPSEPAKTVLNIP